MNVGSAPQLVSSEQTGEIRNASQCPKDFIQCHLHFSIWVSSVKWVFCLKVPVAVRASNLFLGLSRLTLPAQLSKHKKHIYFRDVILRNWHCCIAALSINAFLATIGVGPESDCSQLRLCLDLPCQDLCWLQERASKHACLVFCPTLPSAIGLWG